MTGVSTTTFPEERSWACGYGEDDDAIYLLDTTNEEPTIVGAMSLDNAVKMVHALSECIIALRARKGLDR